MVGALALLIFLIAERRQKISFDLPPQEGTKESTTGGTLIIPPLAPTPPESSVVLSYTGRVEAIASDAWVISTDYGPKRLILTAATDREYRDDVLIPAVNAAAAGTAVPTSEEENGQPAVTIGSVVIAESETNIRGREEFTPDRVIVFY